VAQCRARRGEAHGAAHNNSRQLPLQKRCWRITINHCTVYWSMPMCPMKDITDDDKFEIMRCHYKNMPIEAIAKQFRIRPKSVQKIIDAFPETNMFATRPKKRVRKKAHKKTIPNPAGNQPCPSCGKGVMLLRVSKKGTAPFLGCSKFPECRHTMPAYIIAPDAEIAAEPQSTKNINNQLTNQMFDD
jgi:hypothetical protein